MSKESAEQSENRSECETQLDKIDFNDNLETER